MAPVVDETAEDVPVRDVGLRGGLMPALTDSVRGPKPVRRHHHSRTKMEPQRVFRAPREQLEELCLRLQEENSVLKQHSRSQEQRIRRMSTRLSRAHPSSGQKDREIEEMIQELEARVSLLEGQKHLLQERLNLAKKHLLELGAPSQRYGKVKGFDGEGGVRRATHTAPARYGPTLDDSDRLMSVSGAEQLRSAQLELTAQTLRDSLRDRERDREIQQDMRRTQAQAHRLTIRDNVELLRVQKQLSEKSTALRLAEERLKELHEAFEKQLGESQRSQESSQGALILNVEELKSQLKEERQKNVDLETQLSSATVSHLTLTKLQERVCDLEGERDLIKQNYDSLLHRTFSEAPEQPQKQERGEPEKENLSELLLLREREKVRGLEEEMERLRHTPQTFPEESEHQSELLLLRETLLEEREKVRGLEDDVQRLREELRQVHKSQELREEKKIEDTCESEKVFQQQIVQYKEQVSTLQHKLDSVAQAFDMSVEDLSQTLFQIKEFRLQQESRAGLGFLHHTEGSPEHTNPPEVSQLQASHADTVLELQKTRELLRVEHNITKDLQEELKLIQQRMEREKEESKKRTTEKDKLLSKRSLQITTLQAQLKELAYSPRNYKRTLPLQYTWPGVDQETVQPLEDDLVFSQLQPGESLLQVHIQSVTFTPSGLRALSCHAPLSKGGEEDIVTFCTHSLLDFELLSTPLVCGTQPCYGFTSRYVLNPRDLERLQGRGRGATLELHQAVGGVRFITHGRGCVSLQGALERRGERVEGRMHIADPDGGAVGILDFWARLYPPAEPVESGHRRTYGRPSQTVPTQKLPAEVTLGWRDTFTEDMQDLGWGVPNELLVTLERCVGLTSRWPGLLPDAYLTYRLYDLPPHASPTVQCSADPVYNHSTCYPLSVSADLLSYLRCSSLWVYVFDESDDQIPPVYLAKTPVPLRALSVGRDIRGDYVLRDAAGGPRGVVRILIKWKYPFKAPTEGPEQRTAEIKSTSKSRHEQEGAQRTEGPHSSPKPIAKPRVKPSPVLKQKSAPQLVVPVETPKERRRSSRRRGSSDTETVPHSRLSPSTSSSRRGSARTPRKSKPQDQVSGDQDCESVLSDSGSTHSDVVVVPPSAPRRRGPRLRVEVLSLRLEPSTPVSLDKTVQRLFVEYRLLGVPLHSTETPMSLRKPGPGEEVHYNFSRVIYVDGTHAAPLRHYLFTMLEATDPHQGRLKFTVVSEPMDDEDECVDVGRAFLDLRELLETGEDVLEKDIQILALDEEREDKTVIGHLKVSVEAAVALKGVYREFQRKQEDKDRTESQDRELKLEEVDSDF